MCVNWLGRIYLICYPLCINGILIVADMAPRKKATKKRKNDPKLAKVEAFLDDFDSEGKIFQRYLCSSLSIAKHCFLRQSTVLNFTGNLEI